MFRKIFDTKKTKRSSNRFKSLIHTLSSMNEQDLAKVEKLLELVFDGDTAGVTVSTKELPLICFQKKKA